jgi:hypothetical protein
LRSSTTRAARANRIAPAFLPLISFLLFLAASPPAHAASSVRCDTLLGWNGVAREGRFAPLLVSVENSGAKLQAVVRVDMTWGGLRGAVTQRSFTRQAFLPGGATRRIPFVVPMARGVRSLRVAVSSNGAEVARQEMDLRTLATTDRLVAGISSELSLDMVSALSSPNEAVRLVYPRVDDLPESWAGYDAVDMVVVHDTAFQQLRAAQVAALERWVVTGGSLVFTGGTDALQHAGAGLGRLLPVEVTGLRERDDLPSLAAFLGLRRGPRGRMIIAASRVTTGVVLSSQEGIPIVVQRRLGRGAVWFTAFDPTLGPLGSWEGSLALWRRLAENDRQPVLGAFAGSAVDDPWMRPLLGNPPLGFPSSIAALAFVGSYLVLLAPLFAARFSRRFGTRLRAVLLLCIVAAAWCAGWLLFNRELFRPDARMLDAARVDMVSGDGMARVTEKIGLFAVRPGSAALSLGAADVAVDEAIRVGVPARGVSAPNPGFTVETSQETILDSLSFGRFGSRLLVLNAVIPMPFEARVSGGEPSLTLAVSNGSARLLRRCFLLHAGRAYLVGDVAPFETVTRTFAMVEGLSMSNPDARLRIAGDARRASFLDQSEWPPGKGRSRSSEGSSLFAGWIDGPVIARALAGADRVPDRPALSLIVVEAR